MAPRVSICLPTLNGEPDLRRLLPMLARQRLEGGFEIRAIDSESEDATCELLRASGAEVASIARAQFRHGDARNRCARGSRADVLVFLSQDTLPRDEHFLAHLAAAFDDPRVAGAFSRILPHPDDDPLTARTVLDAPEAAEAARVYEWPVSPGAHANGEERASRVPFNNVASAIRRSVFAEIPFPDVAFGEDHAWALRALEAGWRIRFVPESVVFHAHRYGVASAFERYRVDAAHHRVLSGRRIRPSLASVARGIAHEVGADWRYLARSGRLASWHLARSPVLRSAQVLGQYCGSRGRSAVDHASTHELS